MIINFKHAHISSISQEKWDSMTRKWKDNRSLVQAVKLFLIDEVNLNVSLTWQAEFAMLWSIVI